MAETGQPGIEPPITMAMRLVPPDTSGGEQAIVYSNFVQASISPHDLTMHFSWYSTPTLSEPPAGPIDVPVRGPLVSVSIPLNLIKPVIRVLEAQIASYESSTGQRLPSHEPGTQPKQEQ
jgi:hypothetical protein